MTVSQEIVLSSLPSGKYATIIKLEGDEEFRLQLASLNIRVGKTIHAITSLPLKGPIIVQVDNTKISIGRGIASQIIVEEN